ncbi:MAG: TetR/AcrR family transcriptional regulator [Oscillospiraceae bacterium]|nr:TetR/AcrR family transcriptional regulator [Oscillospiraceae bacterium]
MPRTKIDRRIVKTKRAINGALLQLLDAKEPEDITITELTTYADINRKTFYLHYTCIKDVAVELQKKLRTGFSDLVDEACVSDGHFSPTTFLSLLRDKISANPEFFRAFCLKGTCDYFARTIGDSAIEKLLSVYRTSDLKNSAALRLSVMGMAAGVMQIYLDWARYPSNLTLDEVTAIASRFAEQAAELIVREGQANEEA